MESCGSDYYNPLSSNVRVSRCMRLIRYSLVNVSSGCLNDSDEQLVIFRNSDGKGPRTWGLVQRNFHIVSSELLMRPDD